MKTIPNSTIEERCRWIKPILNKEIAIKQMVKICPFSERIKFSILHSKGENLEINIYTRNKYLHRVRGKYNLEEKKIEKVDKLEEICACPGKAKGVVKIISFKRQICS